MRTQIQSGGLEITEYCNLKCIHCYEGRRKENMRHMDYDKIIYFIEEFIQYGAKEIVLSGGEPFLHPNIIALLTKIGECFSQTPFIITTNGTLLDVPTLNCIEKFDNICVQISVDGATKETHERQHGHATFEKIIDVLEKIKHWPKHRKILRMTISKLNYKESVDVAKMAFHYNAQINYSYVCKVGNAIENWDILGMSLAQLVGVNEEVYRYSVKHPQQNVIPPKSILSCPFENPNYVFGLNIQTDGSVNICTCLDSEYIIGNAYTESFPDFLNSENIELLCKKINERKEILKNSKCVGCSAIDRCGQGCIGRAKRLGDEMGLDDQCGYRRALQFKNLFFYVNKREKTDE